MIPALTVYQTTTKQLPQHTSHRNDAPLPKRSRHSCWFRDAPVPSHLHTYRLTCRSQSGERSILSKAEWRSRAKTRALAEIVEAGKKLGHPPKLIEDSFNLLESLLPDFSPNLDALKASEWAKIAVHVNDVALRIILIKEHYPRLNISKLAMTHPRFLLMDCQQIEHDAQQVKLMLATAPDMDAIISELPSLLAPKTLLSVLVTLRKWYPERPDPVQVLQSDPDVVRRMEQCDIPLEPVFWDGTQWTAATYSGKNKMPWQKWVRTQIYKEKPEEA